MASRTFRLGARVRYPVEVLQLLKTPGEEVKRGEPLFRYSFKWTRTIEGVNGDRMENDETTLADWPSQTSGKIVSWRIHEKQTIVRDQPAVEIMEPCPHSLQFEGLCAMCGEDMTRANWAAPTTDTTRANISMIHDQTNLLISPDLAKKTESDMQRRLLEQRKLSLVVDLDQTIIHAAIEPTIGEWQRDPTNPNHEAVKDVKSFQLDESRHGAGAGNSGGLVNGCWYYIKLRPGLHSFLERISHMYEMHVYTMGTRAYAKEIARIVDPHQKLFSNRVISRDENGNMTAKSLQRLFPFRTHMVVIIYDRADVWPRNRKNLIKVQPYDFFKGIGDINSSFLPKREDILAPPAGEEGPSQTAPGAGKNGTTANGGAKDKAGEDAENVAPTENRLEGESEEAVTQRQIKEQERTLEKQLKDRPLLQLQERLDKQGEVERAERESQNGDVEGSDSASGVLNDTPLQRHTVLRDDDDELVHLERQLTKLHRKYYQAYSEGLSISIQVPNAPLPDVGDILSSIKAPSLRGARIALTGIVRKDIEFDRCELVLQLKSLGAKIRHKVTKDLTHLVVNTIRPRTQKVRQAARNPNIKIVTQDWLPAVLSQWKVVDETPYLFEVHPDDRLGGKNSATTESDESAGEEEEEEEKEEERANKSDEDMADGVAKSKRPKLHIHDFEQAAELDPQDASDEELSPVDMLKTMDWDATNEELEEFLNGDDSDEDNDDGGGDDNDAGENNDKDVGEDEKDRKPPTGDSNAPSPSSSRKRKLDDGDDDDGDRSEPRDVRNGDKFVPTSQKKARTLAPTQNGEVDMSDIADTTGSGLPTPAVTGDEEEEPSSEAGDPAKHQKTGGSSDARTPRPSFLPPTEDKFPGGGDTEPGEQADESFDYDEAALEAEFEAAEFESTENSVPSNGEEADHHKAVPGIGGLASGLDGASDVAGDVHNASHDVYGERGKG